MPDITTIQGQVKERLGELEARMEELSTEFEQLQRIAGMLENKNGRSSAAPAPARRHPTDKEPRRRAAAPRRPSATQQSGGNRAKQALQLIGAKPGLTAAELAESMGMKRNYLYRVLPALEKDGKITKHGKGYHPAETRVPAAV